jgi:hypothetical protein
MLNPPPEVIKAMINFAAQIVTSLSAMTPLQLILNAAAVFLVGFWIIRAVIKKRKKATIHKKIIEHEPLKDDEK